MPYKFNPLSKYGFDFYKQSMGIDEFNTGPLVANTEKGVAHNMGYTDYVLIAKDSNGQTVTLQKLRPDPLAPYNSLVVKSAIDIPKGLNITVIGFNSTGTSANATYTATELIIRQFAYGYEKNFGIADPTVIAIGNSTLHSSLPIQSKMRRAVIRDDGSIKYYLGANDGTVQEDGQAAAIDGTEGQIMTKIPEHYRRESWNGSVKQVYYSQIPLPGFEKIDEQWVGAYEAYIDATGKLCSISGVKPTTNKTIDQFRTAAALRGNGWCQADHEAQLAMDELLTIEYLSLNSQAAVSYGAIGANSTDWGNYNGYKPVFNTGLTNSLGNITGELAQTIANFVGGVDPLNTQVFAWRGIENLWGHIWEFRDGVNIHNSTANGSRVFTCNNPNYFASDTMANYKMIGNSAETDGYGKKMMEGSFIPATVGGGSTTYLSDYFSTYFDNNPDVGYRVLLVGGFLLASSTAGVRYSAVNSSSGRASAFIGSRLCFKPKYA